MHPVPAVPLRAAGVEPGVALFSVLLVLVGLGLSWAGYRNYGRENREIARAHETRATVTGSAVGEEIELDDGDSDVTYYPAVTYTYRFDGRDYSGSRVWAGPVDGRGLQTTGFRTWAEDWVARFPVGSEVPVFVDPSAPAAAFLAVRSRRYQFATFLATAVAGLGLAAWGVARLFGVSLP